MKNYIEQVKIYRIPFCYFNFKEIKYEIWEQGYIEINNENNFDPEKLWRLCNWNSAGVSKPKNLYSNIDSANSDIIFYRPSTNTYYIALPQGWLNTRIDSIEELKIIIENIKTNYVKE